MTNEYRYSFGAKSREVFATLDPRLQRVVKELLKYVDVSLVQGHRGKEEQNALYVQGRTQVKWPKSKHNQLPSKAVDVQPYPYPRSDMDLRVGLGYIAGLAMRIADEENVRLRWGGDWNMNGDVTDNGFDDLFHLEIVE